ncbi:MAG TPA: efflux RND transporter periplasmic adaptor subunit [Bacteroidales bacterium]|nr:efflux RND transporter periplasmic adaptor subunit [Bacteroidales bacterium]
MKTLYKSIAIVTLSAFVAACGSKPTDNKEKLESLRKQYAELGQQIKKLEAELNLTDSTTVKYKDVVITEVQPGEFNHYIEVQGKVDGEDNTAVSAEMSGAVIQVYVKEGDRVARGQTLAQLDNGVMQKQIDAVKQQLDFATTVYEKQKKLWDQKIGSEIQFLTAKNNKETLEKNLATINNQLSMTRIKSPINGTVEEVNLKVGQMAMPGAPAFRVVNFSNAKIMADIAEVYAAKVKTGNTVKIFFPDFNKEVNSSVRFSSKYINPVNRTFTVEMRLGPTAGVDYRANMLAVVKINDYSRKDAVSLPLNLIQDSQEGKYVYIAVEENGKIKARRQKVELGQNYNGLTEIVTGLKKGDKVITTGYNSLVEGELLKVM